MHWWHKKPGHENRTFRGLGPQAPENPMGPLWNFIHYTDVIMGMITSQITSLTIVYSTVYSDADQRKPQSSASLAFVRRIHRRPVNSPHKWPVTWKMFPFDDVIMPMDSLMAPSHYLNQCWLLISQSLWHSPEWNIPASGQAIVLYNEFENYIIIYQGPITYRSIPCSDMSVKLKTYTITHNWFLFSSWNRVKLKLISIKHEENIYWDKILCAEGIFS